MTRYTDYADYVVFSLNITAIKENGIIKKKQLNAPKDWTNLKKSSINPDHNALAILTGNINNIFVIDYDERTNYERDIIKYPELKNYVIKTNKGFHCYLKNTQELNKLKSSRKFNIDFQGDKKCVYCPPTSYEDNEKNIYSYEKITNTTLKDLKEPSKELIKYLYDTYNKKNTDDTPHNNNKINDLLNDMFNMKCKWELTKEKECYIIKNNDYKCLISGDNHSIINHSCLFINQKGYSYITCHSHGKKKITQKETPDIKKLKELLGLIEETERKNNFEILRDYVYSITEKKGYKKEGDFILKKLENVPTHMENYKNFGDFLDEIFSNREESVYKLYRSSPRHKDALLTYLQKYNDKELPRIIRNPSIYSFNNGYFDIDKMKFYTFKEGTKYDNICSSVYINKDFTTDTTETPLWDKLIKHHITDEEIYDIFNALVGRLFYPLKKYDNWQVMLFLIGSANTGKSTIIEIIQSFFYKSDIGSISSNNETTFGLQNLYDKRVIICPDIPHDIKKTLDASLLQSMVSGEQVNVPRKNLNALCVEFSAPMLWAGNYLPNYVDKSRSISRRMAIFKVNNEVKDKDTTLKTKILNNEIVPLFIKFLTSYTALRERVKNITFEDWGRKLDIDYFDKQMEEFRRESDLLYQFITNPPGVNKTRTSNIWIEYKQGEITELEELKKKFNAFLNYKHNIKNYRWSSTSDHSTLEKNGYFIRRLHICAGCSKKSKKGCCVNYNSNNRRRKFVVENMVIRNEFIDNYDD